MANTNEVAVRIDNKGRVTLPKSIRQALGLKTGDTVFLKYEPKDNQVRLAPAVSPFDILAEHAIREHKEGCTKTVEEYAREHGIRLNE
ncbi:MAG: AbrB/MazE/SpoVT family DNA-binding domain-containing protein [Clostridia bacterium]|nr:AbrB/MazE/SpoVT family DNA-binding domain-containing protein [Clostridia bacterium]